MLAEGGKERSTDTRTKMEGGPKMEERREAGERDACREAVERVASKGSRRMIGMAAERSSCCAFKTLGTRHRKHKTDRFLSADSRQSIPNFPLILLIP
jgi:hypothetical protein